MGTVQMAKRSPKMFLKRMWLNHVSYGTRQDGEAAMKSSIEVGGRDGAMHVR